MGPPPASHVGILAGISEQVFSCLGQTALPPGSYKANFELASQDSECHCTLALRHSDGVAFSFAGSPDGPIKAPIHSGWVMPPGYILAIRISAETPF